jgi:hypothetical protein
MASWSKRYTQTYKSSNNRSTRTNNSKGYSTNSTSYKSGATRVTTSTNSKTGKQKVYTTVTNPSLGRMTTSRTVNPTTRYKKPTAWKVKKPRKSRKSKINYVDNRTPEQIAAEQQRERKIILIVAGILFVGFLISLL